MPVTRPQYRMYIDEVGNPGMKNPTEQNRYLSLTGIIINLKYETSIVTPEMKQLKTTYFGSSSIILHRKELINKLPPFQALADPKIQSAFDRTLLANLQSWDYVVVTVVIDKEEHFNKYTGWVYHPYLYCMEILIERYVRWLDEQQAYGDIMAEGRGTKEDGLLKKAYAHLYNKGTGFYSRSGLSSTFIQARITSKEIKLRPKAANETGLQLADLIAYPSYRYMLQYQKIKDMAQGFSQKVVDILINQGKYRRHTYRGIMGYGLKWLPY